MTSDLQLWNIQESHSGIRMSHNYAHRSIFEAWVCKAVVWFDLLFSLLHWFWPLISCDIRWPTYEIVCSNESGIYDSAGLALTKFCLNSSVRTILFLGVFVFIPRGVSCDEHSISVSLDLWWSRLPEPCCTPTTSRTCCGSFQLQLFFSQVSLLAHGLPYLSSNSLLLSNWISYVSVYDFFWISTLFEFVLGIRVILLDRTFRCELINDV
jgi:hypothetical protein